MALFSVCLNIKKYCIFIIILKQFKETNLNYKNKNPQKHSFGSKCFLR